MADDLYTGTPRRLREPPPDYVVPSLSRPVQIDWTKVLVLGGGATFAIAFWYWAITQLIAWLF
jgi:hypothetical protein